MDDKVAGQEKTGEEQLCGDCKHWNEHQTCDHKDSDRQGGVVDKKAGGCVLFHHK